jgi:hypothetical protein
MSRADSRPEHLSASRFDLYRFDDFDPGGQPRYQCLQSDLSLDSIIARFATQPQSVIEEKLSLDAWRGGAFLTPELLVIVAGDKPRV